MKLTRLLMAAVFIFWACAGFSLKAANKNKTQNKEEIKKKISELEKVTEENKLADQRHKKEIRPISESKEKLKAEYDLLLQKNMNETAGMKIQLKKLSLENELSKEKFEKEALKLKYENEKIIEELKLKHERESANIDIEKKRISLKLDKFKLEKEKIAQKLSELEIKLKEREKEENWKNEVNEKMEYLKNPFKDGILTISDRRIPLNGPIIRGMADYITERIHYFNNQSAELPIFIVIDSSPGGSVMQGYRILKAIEASKAPVHVLVKSYAASMAAGITTLAPYSYAYPNAIILHHQMSSFQWGNMTQLEEQLKMSKEWERRVASPVAQKMGISLTEFKKRMYQHNSGGNWEEFADNAVKYKWVDNIVKGVKETGYIKNPDYYKKPSKKGWMLEEKIDEDGKPYMTLPRLNPYDFYFIHNPDKYYR